MTADRPDRIFAVGVNHRTGSVALRDRLFVDEAMLPRVYERFAAGGIRQAVVLSTCDRVEVQGAAADPEGAAGVVREVLAALGGVERETLDAGLYARYDDEAVRHIFAVAASLDSQVIGEPQVLGQVKEGHRMASAAGMVGRELEGVLQAAYAAAKRVRSETAIGVRAVSLAAAAVEIARELHGALDHCPVLLLGLGEVGDLIVQQLRASGVERVSLTGPERRTESEARVIGAHFLPFEDLAAGLARADIVVSAAGLGRYLVDAGHVARALRERRRRPMLFLDGGVPADIEPGVHDLDGAFVYTLDDLERVAHEGRMQRVALAGDAWRIVEEAVAAWRADQAEREAVPAVVALRERFEAARREILDGRPGLDAEEATRLLINRLLHEPSTVLRELAAAGAAGADTEVATRLETMVRRIFGLGPQE